MGIPPVFGLFFIISQGALPVKPKIKLTFLLWEFILKSDREKVKNLTEKGIYYESSHYWALAI